ncbi:MAG TPA: hypothetical protein VGR10_01300 [Thermoleophilaceae bacterium]|nr:hypothetical protein [Thermoleophilaceae bacterium]
MRRPLRQLLLLTVAALVAALAAAPAAGAMESTKLRKNLCVTKGGGKFVDIPGFPGERIDRRLLPDIRWMRRRFDIYITDGYSTASYHAPNGEHPIGLALDIVPDYSRGGDWHDIARLANRTEPYQNQPRKPWRWVGWNGDAGHGWGHHLHLSYMHSYTPPRDPARIVYTRRCPEGRIRRKSTSTATAESSSPSVLDVPIAPAVPETR